MLYKKQLILISAAMILLFAVSIFISTNQFDQYYLCEIHQYTGIEGMSFSLCLMFVLLVRLGWLFVAIFLVTASLLFTKEHIYLAWRKFALAALPVVFIFILTAPASSGGWLPLGYDREFASMFFSGLFLAISWGIITRKTLQK